MPVSQVLGEPDHGFDVANEWLGATRLSVAAMCIGRAQRAFELATEWAATRKQFGQAIGKNQGVSFKLADMAAKVEAARLLSFQAAWLTDEGKNANKESSIAKGREMEIRKREMEI